jgi:hypothetical protein
MHSQAVAARPRRVRAQRLRHREVLRALLHLLLLQRGRLRGSLQLLLGVWVHAGN